MRIRNRKRFDIHASSLFEVENGLGTRIASNTDIIYTVEWLISRTVNDMSFAQVSKIVLFLNIVFSEGVNFKVANHFLCICQDDIVFTLIVFKVLVELSASLTC